MGNNTLLTFIHSYRNHNILTPGNIWTAEFAKFNLDHGFWEWNDWELCFPMDKLYHNTVKPEFSE